MISLAVHLLLTILMVFAWSLGIAGAALAAVLSRVVQLCAVVAHIYIQKLYERSWGGFSLDAFLPAPLYALVMAAVPVATAASNVAFITQVPLLLAATLGPHALAAFVSLEYLSVLFVQIPFAVSSASLFKVSSLLRR